MWKVAWKRSSRDDLATLWMDSDHRAAITAAAHRIDYVLARDPQNSGESREDDRRILIESPLAVIFRVKVDESKVVVIRVWRVA